MKSSVSIGGIGMYGGKYCGTSQYALTWYVLWYVLLCIVFSEYWKVGVCVGSSNMQALVRIRLNCICRAKLCIVRIYTYS